MEIVIASGKGGTGKTFVATNLARVLQDTLGENLTLIDCDVEEPNVHIFFPKQKVTKGNVTIKSPVDIDTQKCNGCGKCVEVCNFNALAKVKNTILMFRELCHACGACSFICPMEAIIEGERQIGDIFHSSGEINLHYATLTCGEGGMTPRLIKKVREEAGPGVNILDAPPGTACPAVESVTNTDFCILVADPTPFGLHDLKLAVNMCRALGQEPVVVVNRANYRNQELKKYCQTTSLEIIGEIPDSREIARIYSRGELVVEKNPNYRKLFSELGEKITCLAKQRRAIKKPPEDFFPAANGNLKKPITSSNNSEKGKNNNLPELVVISGKGGTGKTSLVGAFAALAGKTVVADCDVDASDLPLLLNPEIEDRGLFSGGFLAEIFQENCEKCGLCQSLCRFEAISHNDSTFVIDPLGCEGCGLCGLACPNNAIKLQTAINGEWYTSRIRFGKMAHARLGLAEENSGRLVSLTRKKAVSLVDSPLYREILIDGSPGTGCPVIASLTGSRYAILVTEPTLSGLHDLERIIDLTRFFQIPTGVVVNKWDINQGIAQKIEKYSLEQGIDFLGKFPYDEKITLAQFNKQTIIEYAPDCTLSLEIEKLWEKILGLLEKRPEHGNVP